MGTCCSAHLIDKVENYIDESTNGVACISRFAGSKNVKCDYCKAPAVYVVSYS